MAEDRPSIRTGSFVASCTVQNNTSFDAAFRIAKVHV